MAYENGSLHGERRRQRHFERVPFRLCAYRANERDAEHLIKSAVRQDEPGPPLRLLVPDLRVEIDPDDVAKVRRVQSNTSLPTACPVSHSPTSLPSTTVASMASIRAVSYTHLTLPTIYSV